MIEQALGLSLRDRFFALSDEGASEEDKRRYRAQVDGIEVAPTLELDGLSLSYHPSARFKAVRFVEAERLDERVRSLFARPSAQLPQLAAVFVDPEEFSYRTFENIVPLDRWFEGLGLELALSKIAKLGQGRHPIGYTFALKADEQTRRALAELDALGLYVAPQNPESRGGKRFIFHAEGLSRALTQALRDALPKRWLKGFSHVNPVFRCNRFEPGDAKFRRHVDTPYYDSSRRHISRYTMLIYLTGGRGEPALQLACDEGDVELEQIEALTCVVFRQDLEHEGSAYLDGRKVFLRTELVFEDLRLTHDPAIAQTFAKACYLTGESVFAPELARRTHELYDRAAAAHWAKVRAGEREAEPYLHKRYRNVEFVTNGYDYWFPKSLALQSCAALAVLDTLNCKLGGEAFRKLCTTEVLHKSEPASEWVGALWSSEQGDAELGPLDLRMLFPPCEQVDQSACCPFHAWHSWDATRAEETVDLYERAQTFARRRISGVAITMMGQEIFLDPEKFVIEHDKIHVLSDQAIAPVNFAACWNDGSLPANYLDVEVLVEAPKLLVPPILFVEHAHGHHLMLDLFRNSWMVSHTPRTVPVPTFRRFEAEDYDDGSWESTPWLDAAAGTSDVVEVDDEDDISGPWWTPDDNNAVVRELYPWGGDD